MIIRRGLAWLVLAVWVAGLVAALFLGHRTAPFSDLKTAIVTDWVDTVEVSGSLDDGARGFEVVEVRWQRGWLRFSTLVVEEQPHGAAGSAVRRDDEITAVVDRPVAEVVHDLDPAVTVTEVPRDPGAATLLGLDTPVWADVTLVTALGTMLGLLATGPQPRGATRWGWFWLMLLAPPIGFFGYLMISGVLYRPRPPRPDLVGLRGPWAFLIGGWCAAAWASASAYDVFRF